MHSLIVSVLRFGLLHPDLIPETRMEWNWKLVPVVGTLPASLLDLTQVLEKHEKPTTDGGNRKEVIHIFDTAVEL